MTRRIATCLMILAALPRTAPAQWQLALVGSTASSTGHAAGEDGAERLDVGPAHPGTITLSLARTTKGWRLGLSAHRTTSDLSLRGPETAIVTRGDLAAWGVGADVGRLLLGGDGTPTLHGLIGATAERWTFPVSGGDPRTVMLLTSALEAAVPLSRQWSGLIRAEAAFGGSLFSPDELPPGYAVRTGRRWGFGLGVGWRP